MPSETRQSGRGRALPGLHDRLARIVFRSFMYLLMSSKQITSAVCDLADAAGVLFVSIMILHVAIQCVLRKIVFAAQTAIIHDQSVSGRERTIELSSLIEATPMEVSQVRCIKRETKAEESVGIREYSFLSPPPRKAWHFTASTNFVFKLSVYLVQRPPNTQTPSCWSVFRCLRTRPLLHRHVGGTRAVS